METLGNQIMPKLCFKYFCEICHYGTSKKSSFDNHCLSAKHQKKHNGNVLETFGNQNGINYAKIMPDKSKNYYTCNTCNKNFKNRSGLWKHSKLCKNNNNEKNMDVYEMVKYLMKENNELKNIIIEQQNNMITKVFENQNKMLEQTNKSLDLVKNGSINNSNNNTNSHNKSFNLQFFLNEQCKDAMNLSEFVSSIVPSIEELETTGRLGYAEGISRIIINNLNNIGLNYRPVHCTDGKREIFYIKEDNCWEKESETKPILTKAIKQVAHKNIKSIFEWKQQHPGCDDPESSKNDLFLKIVSNSMPGLNKEESEKNYEKIISNVAKKVIIDKENF